MPGINRGGGPGQEGLATKTCSCELNVLYGAKNLDIYSLLVTSDSLIMDGTYVTVYVNIVWYVNINYCIPV